MSITPHFVAEWTEFLLTCFGVRLQVEGVEDFAAAFTTGQNSVLFQVRDAVGAEVLPADRFAVIPADRDGTKFRHKIAFFAVDAGDDTFSGKFIQKSINALRIMFIKVMPDVFTVGSFGEQPPVFSQHEGSVFQFVEGHVTEFEPTSF